MNGEITRENIGKGTVINVPLPQFDKSFQKEMESAVEKAVRQNICIYVHGIIIDGRDSKNLRIKIDEEVLTDRPNLADEVFDYFTKKTAKKGGRHA